jgi:exodeoxyribonuclease V gamma subunit
MLDRARRDDDRYLFLESLLCARERLYLSYTGRHIRDDTVIPPSVLVSELLDHVAQGFRVAGGDMRAHLVTEHPLQAFSARYFQPGDEKLFTYSEPRSRAATLAGRGTDAPQPLIRAELPPPDDDARTIDLDTLIGFFRHPVKFLLRERLNIRLETAEEALEAREPFTVDTLTLYNMKQQLLDLALTDRAADAHALARGAGVLPHGTMGRVLVERERETVRAFADRLAPLLHGELRQPESVIAECGTLRLTGTVTGVTSAGLLTYRAARIAPNDRVRAWIRHLALNVAAPAGVERVTRHVGQDGMFTLTPVEDAADRLRELVDLYCAGLRRPLHFFPRTACAYAEAGEINYVVTKTWESSEFSPAGESNDPYYRLAFRDSDPLDEEFEHVARIVFGHMKNHSREVPFT